MSHALAVLALHAASAAVQRAHEVLRAAHLPTAAEHVHQAGQLLSNALGLVIVDKARRSKEQETSV